MATAPSSSKQAGGKHGAMDMEAIKAAKVKIGVDPLGGAAVAYWQPIAEMYGLDITVVNPKVDPTFSFMTV